MPVGIDARLKLISGGLYDLDLSHTGDIQSEDFFDTAIIVSLFAERRANESEVLDSALRRGWIGNEATPDFEIGSKIWLYEQSRLTRSVLNNIATAARQSLQWLVDDGYAISIDNVEAIATSTGVNLSITIRRPNSEVEKRHYTLWDNTALSSSDILTHKVLNLAAEDAGINIFNHFGSPSNSMNIVINVPVDLYPRQTSGLITGGPWHPDAAIKIVIASGFSIVGSGGQGGMGGEDWEGTVSRGGGGGGGAPYGLGGFSFEGTLPGDPGTQTLGGVGGIGLNGAYGGTEDVDHTDGDRGYSAIDLQHDVTIENYGSVIGGAGGGGGGGQNRRIGGTGGSLASGIGDDGEAYPGESGAGGIRGKAIELNGHSITWVEMGSITGDVS